MRSPVSLIGLALIASLVFAFPALANPVLGNPIAVVQSAAAEPGHVFKTSSGYLYGISVAVAATSGYVMLFDATAIPSDGAVTPLVCYAAPTALNQPLQIAYPIPFKTGIVAVFSTTGCFTKTGSNAFFAAQFQ